MTSITKDAGRDIARTASALAAALLLAACQNDAPRDPPADHAQAGTVVDPAPVATREPAPPPAAPARGSPEAAADVIRSYYAAIDRGDLATAYRLWGQDGAASGTTLAAFRAGFAETAESRAIVGTPTNGEGAAGSVFIDVPVTVEARLKDGTRQHFAGNYTLRRVNDVPGATAAQLRWHIASAKLEARR